jgi:hypothetical protein
MSLPCGGVWVNALAGFQLLRVDNHLLPAKTFRNWAASDRTVDP